MNLNVECDICVKCLDILDCILHTMHAHNLLQTLSLCIRVIFFPPNLTEYIKYRDITLTYILFLCPELEFILIAHITDQKQFLPLLSFNLPIFLSKLQTQQLT